MSTVSLKVNVCTCVNTQQPGANQWSECLTRFGQQGNHPEEESRSSLLSSVHHKVLVHQIRNDQFQQFACALCKHSVTRKKRVQVTVSSPRRLQSYKRKLSRRSGLVKVSDILEWALYPCVQNHIIAPNNKFITCG